jgi:hypothetical protein
MFFLSQNIAQRSAPILERFEVVKVKDELLFLDLNRWLGKNRSVIDALSKVHVNHAQLREAELVVGNVNFMALFNKGLSKPRDQEICRRRVRTCRNHGHSDTTKK